MIKLSSLAVVAVPAGLLLSGPAMSEIRTDLVVPSGNSIPSVTDIPGLPGYSGYEVHLKTVLPGDWIGAFDFGCNPIDFPGRSLNYGIFGPVHQRWNNDEGEAISSPYKSTSPLDSSFLFDYNISVMMPKENNNAEPFGLTSPLADTEWFDWGVGDEMRAIAGVAPWHYSDMPFAYLVIPDGYTVRVFGQIATGPGGGWREGDIEFFVGAGAMSIPEPTGLAVVATLGLAGAALRRRAC